ASSTAEAAVRCNDSVTAVGSIRPFYLLYNAAMKPLVGIIMGSVSDWSTMRHAVDTLESLRVPHEVRVVSAHRTPDLLYEYASTAVARGLEVIIAGAGGAAHLPGMTAAKTDRKASCRERVAVARGALW